MKYENETLDDFKRACVILFASLHGWKYRAIKQVADSKFYDRDLFLRWFKIAQDLESKSREIALACENEDSIRAWKKAMVLREKMEEIVKVGDYDRKNTNADHQSV